jgi:hypothetical protein
MDDSSEAKPTYLQRTNINAFPVGETDRSQGFVTKTRSKASD